MPIVVGRLFVFFNQCTVNGNVAVAIRCGTARACAGNAVIIFLADDSGFKRALNLNVELIRIAFAVACNERSLTVCIYNELEVQVFIAFCGNGDDIAASDRYFIFGSRVALLRNLDVVIIRILSVCAAGGNVIRLFFPRNAVHLKVRDVAYIAFRLCNLNVPIASERVAFQRNVFDVDGLSRRRGRACRRGSGRCYGADHGAVVCFVQGERQRLIAFRRDYTDRGIAVEAFTDIQSAVTATHIILGVVADKVRIGDLLPRRAANLHIGDRVEPIFRVGKRHVEVVAEVCRYRVIGRRLFILRRRRGRACRRGSGRCYGADHGAVVCFVQGERQRLIAFRRNYTDRGIAVEAFTDVKIAVFVFVTGYDTIIAISVHTKGRRCLFPCSAVYLNGSDRIQPIIRTAEC